MGSRKPTWTKLKLDGQPVEQNDPLDRRHLTSFVRASGAKPKKDVLDGRKEREPVSERCRRECSERRKRGKQGARKNEGFVEQLVKNAVLEKRRKPARQKSRPKPKPEQQNGANADGGGRQRCKKPPRTSPGPNVDPLVTLSMTELPETSISAAMTARGLIVRNGLQKRG